MKYADGPRPIWTGTVAGSDFGLRGGAFSAAFFAAAFFAAGLVAAGRFSATVETAAFGSCDACACGVLAAHSATRTLRTVVRTSI